MRSECHCRLHSLHEERPTAQGALRCAAHTLQTLTEAPGVSPNRPPSPPQLKHHLQDKREGDLLSIIGAADVAAAQAAAQAVADQVVLTLAAVKAWLEALAAAGGGEIGLEVGFGQRVFMRRLGRGLHGRQRCTPRAPRSPLPPAHLRNGAPRRRGAPSTACR